MKNIYWFKYKPDPMFWKLRKMFEKGKEKEIVDLISNHITLIRNACEIFYNCMDKNDKVSIAEVCEIEKIGDSVRREIVLKLYEGAFLPGIRGNLYRLAETLDEVLDTIEDATVMFMMIPKLEDEIMEKCVRIAEINLKMAEELLQTFEALRTEGDLRDRTIKIRIMEEEVDAIKRDMFKRLMSTEVRNFWEGMTIYNFIRHLTNVSDLIEDAGDIIQILNVSLR